MSLHYSSFFSFFWMDTIKGKKRKNCVHQERESERGKWDRLSDRLKRRSRRDNTLDQHTTHAHTDSLFLSLLCGQLCANGRDVFHGRDRLAACQHKEKENEKCADQKRKKNRSAQILFIFLFSLVCAAKQFPSNFPFLFYFIIKRENCMAIKRSLSLSWNKNKMKGSWRGNRRDRRLLSNVSFKRANSCLLALESASLS